jgi:hypothetical protein
MKLYKVYTYPESFQHFLKIELLNNIYPDRTLTTLDKIEFLMNNEKVILNKNTDFILFGLKENIKAICIIGDCFSIQCGNIDILFISQEGIEFYS